VNNPHHPPKSNNTIGKHRWFLAGRNPTSGRPLLKKSGTLCVIVALASLPSAARADHLWKVGVGTDGVVDTPTILNVYWETSQANWDADVAAAQTATFQSAATFPRIEGLTQALVHSSYFKGLAQYNVSFPAIAPSIFLGSSTVCPSIPMPPANTTVGHDLVKDGLPPCLQTALAGFNAPELVLNYIYPPQVPDGGDIHCSTGTAAYHDHSGGIASTFIATNSSCNKSLARILESLSHEMVEAMTDPAPYLGLGWRSYWLHNNGTPWAQRVEAADMCEAQNSLVAVDQTQPFMTETMGASIDMYWWNSHNGCFAEDPTTFDNNPGFSTAQDVCGRGQGMQFNFSAVSDLPPWDLTKDASGARTMYLSLSSPRFKAGAFLRAPAPDSIAFGDLMYNSSCDSSFGCKLGANVVGFTKDVQIAAGDIITFTTTAVSSGLESNSTFVAPAVDTVTVSVQPPASTPNPGWTVFGDGSNVNVQTLSACSLPMGQKRSGRSTEGGTLYGPVQGETVSGSTYQPSDPSLSHLNFSAPSDWLGGVSIPLVTSTAGHTVIEVDTPQNVTFANAGFLPRLQAWSAAHPGSTLSASVDPFFYDYVSTATPAPSVHGLFPLDVHPLVVTVYPSELAKQNTPVTLLGGGFTPTDASRTSVTVEGTPIPAQNLTISPDGTKLNFTLPYLPVGYPAPVVAYVDGVPSVPITVTYSGGFTHVPVTHPTCPGSPLCSNPLGPFHQIPNPTGTQ